MRVLRDVYANGAGKAAAGAAVVVEPLLQEVQTAYEQKYLKEGRKIRYGEFRVA